MSDIERGNRPDLLCPDCGHHLHRPNPGPCQWRDCSCGADRPPVSGEPLPPCPICGKDDLFTGRDGRPGCPHCEVAVVLPPVSGEPRTPSGQRILKEWLMLRPDYPPNTARVRDMIVACEAEASTGAGAPPPLDAHRLGGLIERAIRESRRKNGLLPDGWTLVEMALAYPADTPTEPSARLRAEQQEGEDR